MTAHPAYTLSRPTVAPLPIVIDSPHSGTAYPADFGARLPRHELRRGEDTWIDRLYHHAPSFGATLLAANFPRVYIDPNRSLEDIDTALLDEPWPGPVAPGRKTELGIGLVWRMMDSAPIYDRKLGVAELQRRIEHCWLPYHQALDNALAEADSLGQPRWHLNVHSMPDDSYRRLGFPDRTLADVVLGNLDGSTSDEATMSLITRAFESSGYSVAHNDPFKGVEIIRISGQPDVGRHAVQIEVKRSLYMDANFEPHTGFARLQAAIDGMLAALAAHAAGARPASA
jgi:N-formylglutamate amidohydrolase